MFCQHCGAENPDTNKFCYQCGASLVAGDSTTTGVGQVASPALRSYSKKKKASSILYLAIAGAVLILIVIIAAGVLLLPQILPQKETALLGFPERSGKADLYLLELGEKQEKGIRLVEGASSSSNAMLYYYNQKFEYARRIGNKYGGFIPNSDRVLYYLQQDDKVEFWENSFSGEKPVKVMDTKDHSLWGFISDENDDLFLLELRDDQQRCYIAAPGKEAERIAKGDSCSVSDDDSWAYFSDVDNDKTSVSIVNLKGENETVILNEVKDVESYFVSEDASHLAYLQNTGEGQQLFLVDREGGEQAFGEQYDILENEFIPGGDILFYISETDEGLLELHTSNSAESIAKGVTLGAKASFNGEHLVYLVEDEDGEETLSVHPLQGGEDVQVLKGEDLEFNVLASPAKILVMSVDGDETALYSADVSGANLIELYREDDITLSSLQYVPGESALYLMVRDEDGAFSLYVTPMDRAAGNYYPDEWFQVQLLNRSADGKRLVFWAQEDNGDDPILYSIELGDGARPLELDDENEGFRNAIFAPNGKTVIYTAETGDDLDEVDVLRVSVDGEERSEVLYEGAFLEDVRWDKLSPFERVYWQSGSRGTSFCPGAPALSLGETVEGKVDAGAWMCFRFWAQEGGLVTFNVNTPESQQEEYDFELEFYDRSGNRIDYNDDGPSGYDPRLTVLIDQEGLYFVSIHGHGSIDEPSYSLTTMEGVGEPVIAKAQHLESGSRINDAITEDSNFYLETFDFYGYGKFYSFDAEAGDYVSIDVSAGSVGSELYPEVDLYDQMLTYVDYDSGIDAHIESTLYQAGRYYILVKDYNDNYGKDTHFFELLLNIY